MGKINLLHTVLNLGVGGLERLVYETTMMMDRNRFNVEVCCLNRIGEFGDQLQKNGIAVTLLQKNQKRFDPLYPFKLKRLLREKNIHVLQMHSGTFFYAALAGRLARTPVTVYTDHGRPLNETLTQLLEDRFAARLTDRIVAVSRELEEHLVNVVKLPREKIVTIINGIDTEQFSRRQKPAALLQEFGLDGNVQVIGTVGRLRTVKDHLSLIKAFELVNRRLPNTVLMLVGDGSLRPQLEQYVADRQLKNRVIFTGIRQNIPEMLNLLDLFVLSSLSEGTCVSLLEAMASGLPAVVTDVGGNPSIVTNNVNGLLVKPRDTEQMAGAIIELLTDSERYARMSENAGERMRADFSSRRMMGKYIEIYSDLLNRKRVI